MTIWSHGFNTLYLPLELFEFLLALTVGREDTWFQTSKGFSGLIAVQQEERQSTESQHTEHSNT